MSANWDDIKKEYIDSKGKAVLKELAEKYGVNIGTLRSRKSREDWDSEIEDSVATCNATQEKKSKNVATQNKATKVKEEVVKDIDKEIVEEVLENNELTDKQKMFCIYQSKYFNATKAYQKAYKCDYVTAKVNGCKLLTNTNIQAEIKKLKRDKLNRAMLSENDIFQKMIDIAFADVTDYVSFGTKEIETEIGPMMISYVDLKESAEVDGTILTEVSKGKDGVKVKLADKMRALQWLGDRLDLLPTETREKLKLEEEKLKLAQDKLDLEKEKDKGDLDKPIDIIISKKTIE